MLTKLRSEVVEAARDYKYLLNRGFPQKASLDFVSANYGLAPAERNLLLRCVHRDADSEAVRGKTVREVRGLDLVVDGYNVILTVASAIEGLTLFLCDDGFVRDLRSSYTKSFESPSVGKAVAYVARAIDMLGARSILVVLDKNVSWSARHAELLESSYGIRTATAARADIAVLGSDGVVSSSDFVILLRSRRVYDLAQFVVRNLVPDVEIVDLQHLLGR